MCVCCVPGALLPALSAWFTFAFTASQSWIFFWELGSFLFHSSLYSQHLAKGSSCRRCSLLFFYFFCLHRVACGILVPRPGMEPVPPAVEAWSLNRWATGEVPLLTIVEWICECLSWRSYEVRVFVTINWCYLCKVKKPVNGQLGFEHRSARPQIYLSYKHIPSSPQGAQCLVLCCPVC